MVRLTADRGRHDLAGEPKLLGRPHAADHRQPYREPVHRELIVGNVEGVAHLALLLERRPLSVTPPPCLERPLEIGERLRVSVAVDILEPRELLVLEAVEEASQLPAVRLFACCVESIPLGQCPVIDESRGAAGTRKIARLGDRRVKLNAMSEDHGFSGSYGTWCRQRSTELKVGPSQVLRTSPLREPAEARSLVTLPPAEFVTQMLVPSNATAYGNDPAA